jgi:hypothetical protein
MPNDWPEENKDDGRINGIRRKEFFGEDFFFLLIQSLTVEGRLAWNFQSSCPSFLSAGIKGVISTSSLRRRVLRISHLVCCLSWAAA